MSSQSSFNVLCNVWVDISLCVKCCHTMWAGQKREWGLRFTSFPSLMFQHHCVPHVHFTLQDFFSLISDFQLSRSCASFYQVVWPVAMRFRSRKIKEKLDFMAAILNFGRNFFRGSCY